MEQPPTLGFKARPTAASNSDPENASSTGGHDQLPTVEAYKSQVATEQGNPFAKHFIYKLAIVWLVISIAVTLIAVGVVIGKDSSSPSISPVVPAPAPPTVDPPKESSSKTNTIALFISDAGWSDIITPDSSQWKAAKWLAEDDPKKLSPSDTVEYKERYAAAVLYYAFHGDNWPVHLNWLTGGDVCSWHDTFEDNDQATVKVGLNCNTGNMVQEIRLDGLQMEGQLPTEISLFSTLEDLDLRSNKISGFLPKEMVNIKGLASLVLKDNALGPDLPTWLDEMSNLAVLDLAKNSFTGKIPTTFRKMATLHTLDLQNNQLSGGLDQLEGLARAEALLLANNQFTGALNDAVFTSWKSIKALDVSGNLLTGTLPLDLFAISNLAVVDLSGNRMNGPLPNLISVSSDVSFLALQGNNFTGQLGPTLQFMQQLEHLDLSHNDFTGTMPTEFGSLTSLQYLFLAFNEKLTVGLIPTVYGQLTSLVDLSLQKTNRVEKIPTELGRLSNLVLLDLDQNILTGDIPVEIGSMTSLKFLLLKDNKLDGTLPTSLVQLTNLDTLLIDNNFISGTDEAICTTPRQLTNLTEFIADCQNFICQCCTTCCARDDASCNNIVWFSGLDPVYDPSHLFAREFYSFHQSDTRYPVVFHEDDDN
jgi:Leucine-rich repeat (LRR) protein